MHFYCDSKDAIHLLNCNRTRSQQIKEGLQHLDHLSRRNKVTIKWVKGHSGVEGNIIADSLAKSARGAYTSSRPTIGLMPGVFNEKLATQSLEIHKQLWHASPHRHAKETTKELNPQRGKQLIQQSRKNIKILTNMLTGHAHLNKHLHTIGLADDPICRGCLEDEETAEHVLCHCPAIACTRHAILGKHHISLDEINTYPMTAILEFIKKITWLPE